MKFNADLLFICLNGASIKMQKYLVGKGNTIENLFYPYSHFKAFVFLTKKEGRI